MVPWLQMVYQLHYCRRCQLHSQPFSLATVKGATVAGNGTVITKGYHDPWEINDPQCQYLQLVRVSSHRYRTGVLTI